MRHRIREIRTELGYTQQAFADKIGFSQNYIWQIEKGDRTPSDRTISDICREFHVSEHWLRTGEGDMLLPTSRDDEISDFIGEVMKHEKPDFRRRLITVLARLSVDEWKLLESMALKLAAEYKNEDQAEA